MRPLYKYQQRPPLIVAIRYLVLFKDAQYVTIVPSPFLLLAFTFIRISVES